MFYCACWGSTLLDRVFPRLMRRFTLQTGFAILSMLLVSFISAHGAAAQDAPQAETEALAATTQNTDAPRSKLAPTLRPRLLLPQRHPNPNRATC